MVKKSVQVGLDARRRCPCFGMFCFLCAFITSIFGAKSASAESPLPAIRTTQIALPISVLGLNNPYLIAAATRTPRVIRFLLSRDIRDLAARVDKLARYGVDLNQRKLPHTEKLQLRVRQRGPGGVVLLSYRH
ncbi:MAG TPA: hypothetical protein VFG22_06470 [Polyangiales bacterium]|nr:hypothetical protein [Polyangiales bacterium]